MNVGSINDSLNTAKSILKEAELFKDINKTRPHSLSWSKFSSEFNDHFQGEDYEKIYRIAMEYSDYDIILTDESIFQFSCSNLEGDVTKGTIRYAFYENPKDVLTYEKYLEENGLSIVEDGEELLDWYEQEKLEASIKSSSTHIRYDYDVENFEHIYHPISHLHIGHNNEIRLPLDKLITPAKFVAFVLRNIYPKVWRSSFKSEIFRETCLNLKQSSQILETDSFNEEEKQLLYMK